MTDPTPRIPTEGIRIRFGMYDLLDARAATPEVTRWDAAYVVELGSDYDVVPQAEALAALKVAEAFAGCRLVPHDPVNHYPEKKPSVLNVHTGEARMDPCPSLWFVRETYTGENPSYNPYPRMTWREQFQGAQGAQEAFRAPTDTLGDAPGRPRALWGLQRRRN
jgi:hypothetical protein